ncbi:MAG: LysR family transcriptional regulator [Polyangiaceae bacterium]
MPSPIDAEHLDAFVTFAEHMNFTRAARARRMSQPALHTQVQKLAAALGVELYVKRGNKLTLTPDGQRVLGFGRDARERTRAFVAELSHREVRGPIVLCAGEGAYLYLLGEGVRRFAKDAGSAGLRLLVRDQDGTVEAVRTGESHLGVASLDAPPPDLRVEPIAEVGQVVLVPEAHPLAAQRTVRLRDLAGERLVVPPAGRPHRWMVAQALRAAGVRWDVGVEASGWELLARFAEIGLGLAIVNAFCRAPQGMVARPMPELPSRVYYLLQRSEAAREGPIAALAAAIREGTPPFEQRTPRRRGSAV